MQALIPNTSAPVLKLLDGLRILEVGHFIAAPFAARVLADLGAEIIKVEPPSGDPVRTWGARVEGRSLWWSVHGRNKKCVTLDLKSERGRALLFDLVERSDGLIENFRPGQLEKLEIGPAQLHARNSQLVIARISGYGQDGPYRDRAAFGVIGEALGGIRHLTNHAASVSDLPPVRVGVSIGDSIAGLYAALGMMATLWKIRAGDAGMRCVDVALSEAVLSMMEGMLPEYGRLGVVKQPVGGAIATAAPSNAYPTADGQWVLIAANSDPLFERLARVIGAPELAKDLAYRDNPARVANAAALDARIGAWTRGLSANDVLEALEVADVPSCKIYDAADCAGDPQYRARGMVREVEDAALGAVLHPGVVPKVEGHDDRVRWCGPDTGAHNAEIYGGLLGLSDTELEELRTQRVI